MWCCGQTTSSARVFSPVAAAFVRRRAVPEHRLTCGSSAASQSFASRLRSRERLVGTLVSLDCPAVVEILVAQGFDWLFCDLEHNPLAHCLPSLLRAAGACPVLVRLPSLSEEHVKFALDLGAAGIIAPQVNTEQQARDLVSWAKYSPEGRRGVGAGRAHKYGMDMGYLETANEQTVVVAQIEHIEAVNNCDAIAAVTGIDALFIGPYDLSSSLGLIGQVTHPTVLAAMQRVAGVAEARGTALGAFGIVAASLSTFPVNGASLLTVGIDALMLARCAGETLAAVRGQAPTE